MPETSFFINVDDESPLVTYSPAAAWQNQNTSTDANAKKESSQETFHVTKATNASASLTFLGTGIYVYGSKQSDHREYAVLLDNGTMIQGFSGQSTKATYQSHLAIVKDLPLGTHTIKIINMGDSSSKTNGTLDIDEFFVEFDLKHGTQGIPGVALVDDNETSLLKYSNGWGLSSLGGPAGRFINDTVHETTTPGSSVTWDFYGSGVQVVGGVGPQNGAYSVQVDGQNYTLDAGTENFVPSHMLFYLDNMTSTHHTLTLTHTGPAGKALTVDYFMAFNSTNTTAHTTSNDEGSDKKGLKPGAIAAIVILILLLVGLIAGGGLYMYRKKRMEAYAKATRGGNGAGPYGGGEPKGDLESGTLGRRNSQSSNNSSKTVVGETTKKFGEWFGFKSGADAPAATPAPPIQDRVIVIGDPDRGIGKTNGYGNQRAPESRHSKATSFDEAWDKRDRRQQLQSVYEDVDLQTPQAPHADRYNHQRSQSSPGAMTPLAHGSRWDNEQRESYDPRAPWDPRRHPSDYEESSYGDSRSRRPNERDRDRDDDYGRNRYDPRPAQPQNRFR